MQVTKIVQNANSEYFSSKIAKCTNCKQLFNVSDKLLGRNIALPLPTRVSLECPRLFLHFSMTKWPKSENILTVEQQHMSCPHLIAMMLNINTLHSPPLSQLLLNTYFQSLLSVLQSCDLDPIPTSLLLDVVLPSMNDIINDSLVSGVFPTFYKSAIVKPLLKKMYS